MSRVGAGLPGMAMEKASLVTIDSFLVGGLTFKYNPTQFSLSRSTSWDNPGVSMETQWAPPLYQSTSPTSISMEIFLDALPQRREFSRQIRSGRRRQQSANSENNNCA